MDETGLAAGVPSVLVRHDDRKGEEPKTRRLPWTMLRPIVRGMWAGRIRVRRARGDEGRRHVGAWLLAATLLLAACTMDSAPPPGGVMDSSLGDGGRLDASAALEGSVADAGHREAAAAGDAGGAGDAAPLGSLADGDYRCAGQSTTSDPCTEFLLNPQLQTEWSLRLTEGELEIVSAGFDLDEISCTGQRTGDTFRCFATMHANGVVCDDQLNLQSAGGGTAVFWVGEDTNPPAIRAWCMLPAP